MDPTSMGRQTEAEDGDSSATLEGAVAEDPTAGDLEDDGDSSATTASDGV